MFKLMPKLLLGLLISGLVLTGYSLSRLYKDQVAFPHLLSEPISQAHSTSVNEPVRLKIPILRINAPIESVGVTALGAMDVPVSIENVAWFSLGTVPGEIGSAVIGGHYGWKDEKASAFDDLHQIQVGNLIHVISAAGNVATFEVREIKIYAWDSNANEIFTSTDGKSHLNLITCAGTWDAKNHTYLKRLVVFADKVE
jgi:LPXTG-site transpeptidase (sortase) family protein